MAFWSNWSDGKKWLMGIISALIIAAIIGIFGSLPKTVAGPHLEEEPSKAPNAQGETTDRGDIPGPRVMPNQAPPLQPSVEPSHPEPGLAKGAQVDTGEGVTFTLNRCYKNGDKVRCELSITSNEDKELMLFGNSRLIEVDGTEVLASKVSLGNDEVGGRLSSVAKDLVRNVPIKAGISFDGVDPNAKAVNLIELKCSPANARFRDVALQ